jgi:hypothetical protein
MKVIFCIPGNNFSGNFLKSWTSLLLNCFNNNIEVLLSQRYNPNIYYVRSECLGANLLRGKKQVPFDNKINYDYLMWIDSDQIFAPEHFFSLLSDNKDIVGGLYLMEGRTHFASVKTWDEDYFRKNGTFQYLTPKDLSSNEELIEVVYSGFGFLLIKRGVFESLEYPWFEPQTINFGNDIEDFASDDISFCIKAKKAGYQIFVDPKVIIGHEKSEILYIPKLNLEA